MQSCIQFKGLGRGVEKQLCTHGNVSPAGARHSFDAYAAANFLSAGRDAAEQDSENNPQTSARNEAPDGFGMQRGELEKEDDVEAVESEDEDREPRSLDNDRAQNTRKLPQTPPLRPSLSRTSTRSIRTVGTRLGLTLTGINVRDRTTNDGGDKNSRVFVVGYEGPDDPMNPQNWSRARKTVVTIGIAAVGFIVGVASSIDSSAVREAAAEFGVSEVVESMATGLFLVGFGVGALFAGPISETLGRNPVYIGTLFLYMVFIMASALAPNIGAQLAFRFIAGFFGSTPLTCAGGSMADIWSPLERVYIFPIFANAAFSGPVLGPVMGGFIVQSNLVSWRWTEWTTLIGSSLVLGFISLFQPETYTPILLKWKAAHLRHITGDERYAAPIEVRRDSFLSRLITSLYRPFRLSITEPIVILVALYLSMLYIILFTFLDGYDFIFRELHHTSSGITGLCFLGIEVGLCIASMIVPLIWHWAKQRIAEMRSQGIENPRLAPEFRLWYAMLGGSTAIPVSLFWMGWTSDTTISIWSPLAASAVFGYGVLTVFISCYQYIIDSYEIYAASALALITFLRYAASGGMVVVGFPFYQNLGVHYTLTILACLSIPLVPVPYVFYYYGETIRGWSRFAVGQPAASRI